MPSLSVRERPAKVVGMVTPPIILALGRLKQDCYKLQL